MSTRFDTSKKTSFERLWHIFIESSRCGNRRSSVRPAFVPVYATSTATDGPRRWCRNHHEYFEVQILQRFGIAPIWTHCVVCGETKENLTILPNMVVWYAKDTGRWMITVIMQILELFISFGCFQLFLMIKSVESIWKKKPNKQSVNSSTSCMMNMSVSIWKAKVHWSNEVLGTRIKDVRERHVWKDLPKRRIVNETYNKIKPFDKHREFRLLLTVDQIDRSLRIYYRNKKTAKWIRTLTKISKTRGLASSGEWEPDPNDFEEALASTINEAAESLFGSRVEPRIIRPYVCNQT